MSKHQKKPLRADDSSTGRPRRQLSLFDSISIIVGIIIGAGIYRTTPLIAAMAGSPTWLLLVWLIGGVLALIGAVCYAELATRFPQHGGDYNFLVKAYGQQVGFVFAWAEYWIIRPGNIGMMSFVFADYGYAILRLAFDLPEQQNEIRLALAATPIILLTGVNLLGVRTGKWTQNALAVVKVVGLLLIFAAGIWVAVGGEAKLDFSAKWEPPKIDGLHLAMVLALFTYGGWNEISYVAAEVRDPRRNLVRSLVGGVIGVTIVYLLVTIAFMLLLDFNELTASSAVASDALTPYWGAGAGVLVSVLICLSCLGAINGLIFAGSRVYYAVGQEVTALSWLGAWGKRFDAPLTAVSFQGIVAVVMVIAFGWNADGFERLLYFTTPLFWLFIFMVGVALFILRHKQTQDAVTKDVFLVPFFPWLPILFCLSSASLLISSLEFALQQQMDEAFWAFGWIGVGVILSYFVTSKRTR